MYVHACACSFHRLLDHYLIAGEPKHCYTIISSAFLDTICSLLSEITLFCDSAGVF